MGEFQVVVQHRAAGRLESPLTGSIALASTGTGIALKNRSHAQRVPFFFSLFSFSLQRWLPHLLTLKLLLLFCRVLLATTQKHRHRRRGGAAVPFCCRWSHLAVQ